VASPPQCDSLVAELIEVPLLIRVVGPSLRALDAHPARETLMIVIMFNATTPAGYASDLVFFRH
jgi:hypothetical protein